MTTERDKLFEEWQQRQDEWLEAEEEYKRVGAKYVRMSGPITPGREIRFGEVLTTKAMEEMKAVEDKRDEASQRLNEAWESLQKEVQGEG